MLSEQLRQALLDYAVIEREVSTAGPDRSDDAKRALLRNRRLLAEQLGRLGLLIDRDEALATAPDTQQEMNQLFAGMRYALALHQADWPVVRIDEDPVAYQTSAQRVQVKSAAFWGWCRDRLGLDNIVATADDNQAD